MLWWTLRQLESYDPLKREKAIKKLSKTKDARVVAHLISALANSSYRVRQGIIQALYRMGDAQVDARVTELLVKLLEDKDSFVRHDAIRTLEGMGDARVDTRVTEHLAKLIEDKEFVVKRAAISALVKIGGEQVKEPLMNLFKDVDVREAAAKRLSQISVEIGDKQFYALVATLFIDSVGDDYIVRQRIKAAKELGSTGDARAVEPLITAIYDSNKEVQIAAIEALVKIADARALGPLKDLYRRKGLWKLRNGADPDTTTGELEYRAKTVGKAAAAAIKKLDPTWSEPMLIPHFVIIFRQGKDQPPDAEQYYKDVVKQALGKELRIHGWRIVGTLDNVSIEEASSIYHRATAWAGGLPNWGIPIKAWGGQGSDGRNVVALFFA
jgi:HEAT repeat protein